MGNISDVIVILILVLLVGAACTYIWKAKKSGKKCIGCSAGGGCSSCKSCDESVPNNKANK